MRSGSTRAPRAWRRTRCDCAFGPPTSRNIRFRSGAARRAPDLPLRKRPRRGAYAPYVDALRARPDGGVLRRQLRGHVEELAMVDRLAQGLEHGADVLARLPRVDLLALGHAGDELIE